MASAREAVPKTSQMPRKSAQTHSRQRSEVYSRGEDPKASSTGSEARVHLQRRRGERGRFSPRVGSPAQCACWEDATGSAWQAAVPGAAQQLAQLKPAHGSQKSYSVKGGQQRPSARGAGQKEHRGRGQAGRGPSTPHEQPRQQLGTPAPRRDTPILRWLCRALALFRLAIRTHNHSPFLLIPCSPKQTNLHWIPLPQNKNTLIKDTEVGHALVDLCCPL